MTTKTNDTIITSNIYTMELFFFLFSETFKKIVCVLSPMLFCCFSIMLFGSV